MSDKPGAIHGRMLIWSIVQFGLFPYLAYELTNAMTGRATLIGSYLLVSPLISGHVASLFFRSWFTPKTYAEKVADDHLQELADWYARELRIPRMKVVVFAEPMPEHSSPLYAANDRLRIVPEKWKRVTRVQQEFGLADVMAYQAVMRKPWNWYRILLPVLIFFASCLASQSLWAIIPLHTVGLLVIFGIPFHMMKWATLEADRRALSLTRDLKAAREYIEEHTRTHSSPWLKLDERIRSLELAATKLRLS